MKSLYSKFVVTTIAIMILSGLTSFLISNIYYQQILKPYNDEKNTAVALEVSEYASSQPNLESYLENIATIGYQLYITDGSDEGRFFGAPFRKASLPNHTKQLVLSGSTYHGIQEFPQETFVTGFFANELTNTIGVPIQHKDQTYALFIRPDIKMLFNELHLLFAWMLLLAIILSVIFVLISTKFLVKPITKLKVATQKLSEGNFAVKLDIDRNDEIGELAQDFTYMAEQLEKLDELKNEFIGNISHDIQSPLSNIKGYSRLLPKEGLSEDEKLKYISIINNEIDRLSNLTNQLLLLSSIDRHQTLIKKSTYSLSEQIKEVVRQHQWAIHNKGIMVKYTLSDIYIFGDQSLLYSVWENLLTNAIKYNHKNGTIDLSATEQEKEIIVRVQDSGIGLSEVAKKRIFERFYREDSSRSQEIYGSGLGLAIVFSIVKLHHGRIDVESNKGEGSTFTIYLPKE